MIRVLDARFVTTAVDEKGYPRGGQPEIAFVGRSNVGKSSMINALTGRKKLVRVSNTPGRTRALNFFDVDLEAMKARLTVRLVDLPGYGFAKVSKADRALWEQLISRYLEQGSLVRAVVSIIDAEVGPTPEDQHTLAWLSERAPRVLVVATKIDRLSKAHRKPRALALAQELGLPVEAVVPFSAVERLGVDEVWSALWDVLASGSKKR